MPFRNSDIFESKKHKHTKKPTVLVLELYAYTSMCHIRVNYDNESKSAGADTRKLRRVCLISLSPLNAVTQRTSSVGYAVCDAHCAVTLDKRLPNFVCSYHIFVGASERCDDDKGKRPKLVSSQQP